MIQRELTVQEALELGKTMPFAYIARLSEVWIGTTPESLSLEELTEARFFGPDGEIRIYYDGSGLSALELRDDDKDKEEKNYIDKESKPLPNFGTLLKKRQYLAFDEDGQAYVAATRLLSWEN